MVDDRGSALRVVVEAPAPFTLVFLPAEDSVVPQVASGGQVLRLDGEAPVRLAKQQVTVWLDPGPPERAVQEVEETLERLQALGYI